MEHGYKNNNDHDKDRDLTKTSEIDTNSDTDTDINRSKSSCSKMSNKNNITEEISKHQTGSDSNDTSSNRFSENQNNINMMINSNMMNISSNSDDSNIKENTNKIQKVNTKRTFDRIKTQNQRNSDFYYHDERDMKMQISAPNTLYKNMFIS